MESSDDEPIAKISRRNYLNIQALLSEPVEERMPVDQYVKQLEQRNEALTKKVAEQKSEINTLVQILNHEKEENSRINSLYFRLVRSNMELTVALDTAESELRTATKDMGSEIELKTTIGAVKDHFYDVVSADVAVCPVLLTSGNVMGFESVVDLWLHSDFFDGRVNSPFVCPLTRQAISVAEISSVVAVAEIAKSLGLNMTMPFSFDYDSNRAPENFNPMSATHTHKWVTYDVESQLQLFAALIVLYRDRQFGPSTRVVQICDSHTVVIKIGAGEMRNGSRVYKVDFSLSVVDNMMPYMHRIRYVCGAQVKSKLAEFAM
jgi:hypothetical protein